jgi:CheY-like chemotaxis protein
LKQQGFTFVGSTICYSFLQAAGVVNDHLVTASDIGSLNPGGRNWSALCQTPDRQYIALHERMKMTPASKKTILIVEDDENTSSLIALYLEREGFSPVTAGDGEMALALAGRHQPDLVILDLMIPKVDGWEVCRRLRQTSEVPVIMLTARGEEIDRVAGLTWAPTTMWSNPSAPGNWWPGSRPCCGARRRRNEKKATMLIHGPVRPWTWKNAGSP